MAHCDPHRNTHLAGDQLGEPGETPDTVYRVMLRFLPHTYRHPSALSETQLPPSILELRLHNYDSSKQTTTLNSTPSLL